MGKGQSEGRCSQSPRRWNFILCTEILQGVWGAEKTENKVKKTVGEDEGGEKTRARSRSAEIYPEFEFVHNNTVMKSDNNHNHSHCCCRISVVIALTQGSYALSRSSSNDNSSSSIFLILGERICFEYSVYYYMYMNTADDLIHKLH